MNILVASRASSVVLALLFASRSDAGPVLNSDWGGYECHSTSPLDLVTSEATSPAWTAWVVGQSEGHQGYEITLTWSSPDGTDIPDAWRFDAAGCQSDDALLVSTQNPFAAANVCGFGLSEPRAFTRNVVLDYDPTLRKMILTVSVAYPLGNASPFPTHHYLAARVQFEGAETSRFGVTVDPGLCGGLERPVCFRITSGRYQNLQGEWVSWVLGRSVTTAHGPNVPAPDCLATPVVPSTWGRLRDAYR